MGLPIPYPSDGDIQRFTGSGPLRDIVIPSSFDYTVTEDSFGGDAIVDEYPGAKTNGTSAAVTFTEHNANKYLDLISGTANDGYAGQGYGMHFTGDRGCLSEFIVRTPAAITTMKFEVGLSDADDDAGAVNQKAESGSGTSATAGSFAVFVFDTDDDANIAFVSAKAGTVVSTHDIQAAAVDTTYRFAIRVTGDNVEGFINGSKVAAHGGNAGIEGGTGLTPWTFVQARNGSASRTLQWHKWRVTQPAY